MGKGAGDNLFSSAGGALAGLLSVLFPHRCVHCGREGEQLCRDCRARLRPLGPYLCHRCGKPSLYDIPDCPECRGRRLYFRQARAAFSYSGPARSMVHALKYSGQRRLALLMADLSCKSVHLTDAAERANLTYVPLHDSKLLSRGYNQAGSYAKALAKRLDLPLHAYLLKRVPTPSQNLLNFHERRNNLLGSIALRKGAKCDGGRIILVDDVYTTGSTASECARVLKAELTVEVDVWTFARTVRR